VAPVQEIQAVPHRPHHGQKPVGSIAINVSVIVFVLIGKRVNENIGIIITRKRRDLIG
jgi:hypothetical protein